MLMVKYLHLYLLTWKNTNKSQADSSLRQCSFGKPLSIKYSEKMYCGLAQIDISS